MVSDKYRSEVALKTDAVKDQGVRGRRKGGGVPEPLEITLATLLYVRFIVLIDSNEDGQISKTLTRMFDRLSRITADLCDDFAPEKIIRILFSFSQLLVSEKL